MGSDDMDRQLALAPGSEDDRPAIGIVIPRRRLAP